MNGLTLTLLQQKPGSSLLENLEIGKKACVQAKALGADIALFPEMWSIGYHIYSGRLDLDALRAYRQKEVFGNAYRHPRKYWKLVDEGVWEPFIRADYRP